MYNVTNLENEMYYIGKKHFTVKDWPTYLTSSKTLKSEILATGPYYLNKFRFDMLFTCGDKNSLSLSETYLQLELDVIHDPKSYNKAISGQRFLGATKHTPDAVIKLAAVNFNKTNKR